MTEEERKAAEEAKSKAEADAKALTDKMTAEQEAQGKAIIELGDSVKLMATKLETLTAEKPEAKPVNDAAKSFKAAVDALIEDKIISVEDKQKKLQDMAVEAQKVFSQFTGTPVDPKAVAKLDAMKAANESSAALADAMKVMLSTNDKNTHDSKMTSIFDKAMEKVGGPEFSDDDRKKFSASLVDKAKVCKDEDEVKKLIEDSVDMMNMGRAKERLLQMGYTKPNPQTDGPAGQEQPVITDAGTSHLNFTNFLFDKSVASGEFKPTMHEGKALVRIADGAMHPQLKALMDQWDKLHGHELKAEQDKALAAGGGRLTDQTLHADFETPFTIARMVLFEAYADEILLGVTSFGIMENDRDQVPITRWRRESTGNKTFLPSVKERSELLVGELQPIKTGKLTTEFFPIDAVARKLRALLSDEFITRARRRPDITGIAMAAQNLVDDVRRSLEQDIFFEMIRCSLLTDAVSFTSAQDGDAATATFQMTSATSQVGAIAIDPADAETIVPNSLTIEVDSLAVPEFGTTDTGGGPGGTFFFVVNHALGLVTFVDAAGAANPPPATATGNVEATAGLKAGGLSAGRFDLTVPASPATQKTHMDSFLFQIQNLGASLPSNTGFSPDILVQSRIVATLLQQAESYQVDARRRAFKADGPVVDGNFGATADLRHFASRIWPNNFTIVGLQAATLYRVYEPLILRGPIEARNSSGELIGGKEWYSYQEDSIACPLPEKLALITTFNS